MFPGSYFCIMGIKEDIKQVRDFRNDYQMAAVNIIYTCNWMTEAFKQMLEPYDITHQQYNVLRILKGSYPEPISTLEIRSRMLDKMSDVSRMVDRLVLKELVTKTPCPSDKRLVDVLLSEKGHALLQQMSVFDKEMDNQLNNLTPEEARHLSQLLDKIRAEKA